MLSKMSNMSLGEQLYNAAARGDIDEVRFIVTTGKLTPDFDINYQNDQGNTALYITSSWGFIPTTYSPLSYFEIVKFLLENGADPNIPNNEKKTPLYIAASWGHPHVVEVLIKAGADLDIQVPCESDFTPLQIAAYLKRYQNPCTKYKPHSKHHAYYVAKEYMENLMKVGDSRHFPEVEQDYKDFIAHQAVDPTADTPNDIMDIIAKYNHFDVVEQLVNADTGVNIPDKNKKTALQKASLWNHQEMITFLQEKGAIMEVVGDNQQNVKHENGQLVDN